MFRAEAYQTILKVFKNLEFSDAVLRQRAAKIHGEASNIPLFYTLVKGVVKQRLKLDFILSHYTDDKKFEATDIKIKIMLYIGLYQLMYMDSIPACGG